MILCMYWVVQTCTEDYKVKIAIEFNVAHVCRSTGLEIWIGLHTVWCSQLKKGDRFLRLIIRKTNLANRVWMLFVCAEDKIPLMCRLVKMAEILLETLPVLFYEPLLWHYIAKFHLVTLWWNPLHNTLLSGKHFAHIPSSAVGVALKGQCNRTSRAVRLLIGKFLCRTDWNFCANLLMLSTTFFWKWLFNSLGSDSFIAESQTWSFLLIVQ